MERHFFRAGIARRAVPSAVAEAKDTPKFPSGQTFFITIFSVYVKGEYPYAEILSNYTKGESHISTIFSIHKIGEYCIITIFSL